MPSDYQLNVTFETYAVGDLSCSGNPIKTEFEPVDVNECLVYQGVDFKEWQSICEPTVGRHEIFDVFYEAENGCDQTSEKSTHSRYYNEQCITEVQNGVEYPIKILFECGDEYKPVDLEDTNHIPNQEPIANPLSVTAQQYAVDDIHCTREVIRTKSYTVPLDQCVEDTFNGVDMGNKNICHNGTGTDQLYSFHYPIGTECQYESEKKRDSYSDGECIQREWDGDGGKYPTKFLFTCSHPAPQPVAKIYGVNVKFERYEVDDSKCSGNPIEVMTEIDAYIMNECRVGDDPKEWEFKRGFQTVCESEGNEHQIFYVYYARDIGTGFGCDAPFEYSRYEHLSNGNCRAMMVGDVMYPTKASFQCGEEFNNVEVIEPDPKMTNPLELKFEKHAVDDVKCNGQVIGTEPDKFTEPVGECIGNGPVDTMSFCENVEGRDRLYWINYQKETECTDEVRNEEARSFVDGDCFQWEWEEDKKYPTTISFTCSHPTSQPMAGGTIAPNPDQPPITPNPAENGSKSGMSTIDLILICILIPVGLALVAGVVYLLYKANQLESAVRAQEMDGEQGEDAEVEELQGTVGN